MSFVNSAEEQQGRSTPEEKRNRIAERSDWFHSIDVGGGVVTPGVVTPEYEQHLFQMLQIPKRLDGLRVLDIGTYDGLYAFECERRGAAEVVAIDVHPSDCRCFKLAHDVLASTVKYHHMSVYEMDEETLGGKFDLILFPGVFYHLRHILMSFDNIWKLLVPHGIVLVETHVCDSYFVLADGTVTTLKDIDPRLDRVPLLRFYRKNDLNPVDWSNWFGGNVAALLDIMGSAGFNAEHLGSWGSRAAFRGIKNPRIPREWELGSYEGSKFEYNSDGTWRAVWHDPNRVREPGARQASASSASHTAREGATTAHGEISSLTTVGDNDIQSRPGKASVNSLDSIIYDIIQVTPNLHNSGTFGPRPLETLARHLAKRHIKHSAETGSGASTLLFSHCSDHHIAFTIDSGAGSVINVKASPLLRVERVTWIEGPTQLTLPKYRFEHTLQAALIDGPHAYPFPDLEYYYLYQVLDPGALLVIDDIQIPTIHNLFEFLKSDRMFVLDEVVETTAFFTRTDTPLFNPTGDGWWEQGYNRLPAGTSYASDDLQELAGLRETLNAIYQSRGWRMLSTYYRWRNCILGRLHR